MLALVAILVVCYANFFRVDINAGTYDTMSMIIRGLNSNLFNYLRTNTYWDLLGSSSAYEHARYGPGKSNKIKEFNMTKHEESFIKDSIPFFSQCVRLNRPCKLVELAKDWPALSSWKEENGGQEYLSQRFGDANIGAYTEAINKDIPKVETRKYSFNSEMLQQMNFTEYLHWLELAKHPDEKLQKIPTDFALKITNTTFTDWIKDDIKVPEFYSTYATLKGIEFY
jgi:hypothetical protein